MDVQTEWFQDGTKARKVLAAGAYAGTLVEIKPGTRASYDGQGVKPCLTFVFETEAGARVSRTVTSSRAERSSCMGLIRALSGSKQPAPEVIGDSKQLQAHLLGLVGLVFQIQVEPSPCGRFNNLVTVTPPVEQKAGEL